MRVLCLIFIILLWGCSHRPTGGISQHSRHIDGLYQPAGIIQYFNATIPDWAQTSIDASCFQEQHLSYLNFEKLMGSFSLSYSEALHFQYSYNIEYAKKIEDNPGGVISLREEERLFFDILDQVRSAIYTFQLPRFNRINLVWIDPLVQNFELSKLDDLMNSSEIDKGFPVFISLCLTRDQVADVIRIRGYEQSVRIISYEMLSAFNRYGKLTFLRQIDFDELLAEKQIYFFHPREKSRPREFLGEMIERPF